MEVTNLFAGIPASLPDEVFESLERSRHVRIERIVSHGHASPQGFWYDQPEAEFVLLLQGAARLRFEGDDAEVKLRPGDWVTIPAHCRHRVEWTPPDQSTVWLAVHFAAEASTK